MFDIRKGSEPLSAGCALVHIGLPHIVRKGQARFRLDPNDTGGKHGGNIRQGKPPRNR